MNSTLVPVSEPFALSQQQLRRQPPCLLLLLHRSSAAAGGFRSRRSLAIAANGSGLLHSSTPVMVEDIGNVMVKGYGNETSLNHPSFPVTKYKWTFNTQKNGVYTVGDFMTKKKNLFTVKPSTTVDEALEILVENRISGFPVVDDDRKLVGLVSDYDLLALDSVSGSGKADGGMFPVADSNWKVFNELQRLLIKTNGKLISDVMTVAPIVVRENTNLEDAARLLLETRHRRLPVVDANGKLVGLITRGDVIRAALKMKRAAANN